MMTIVIFLKFFHYISLFLAGGLGLANTILVNNHQKAEMPPALPVQKTMMTLARLGLVAIVVLWITGIALTHHIYGSFSLGWAFHLKLFGATVLLGGVSFLNFHLSNNAKNENPPDPKVMKIVPPVLRTSLIIVLVGVAVLTTAG